MVDLPAPERPVNQSTQGFCPFSPRAHALLTSSACQWTLCERRSAKCSSPAPTVVFVMRSMRMKPPRSRFSRVRLEHDRLRQLETADADVVELELLGGDVLQRVDVDLVLERRHGRASTVCVADLHQVRPALQHRPVVHPDDRRLELIGDRRRRVAAREDVAAAHVDFVGQRQRDRLPGDRRLDVAVADEDRAPRGSDAPTAARGRRRPPEPLR